MEMGSPLAEGKRGRCLCPRWDKVIAEKWQNVFTKRNKK